jgi:hypothetical protein
MIFYLLTAVVALALWYFKDFLSHDILHDYSDNEVPLVKTSFNLALRNPGENFDSLLSRPIRAKNTFS